MKKGDRIRCPRCGMPVPNVPEDAMYEETLCCRCYDEYEMELEEMADMERKKEVE